MTDPREFTARLLGPAEPEISCEECFDRLDEFVDAELAVADATTSARGMTAHLQGCPACREDYESLLTVARSEPRSP
jgi:predicted anti-sigma-YlaC factor YlaD